MKVVPQAFSKEKAAALLENGAIWAESSAELAAQWAVIYTMLSTPNVVREVALGSNGFLSELAKDSLWVDCSTVNPSFSQEMATVAG